LFPYFLRPLFPFFKIRDFLLYLVYDKCILQYCLCNITHIGMLLLCPTLPHTGKFSISASQVILLITSYSTRVILCSSQVILYSSQDFTIPSYYTLFTWITMARGIFKSLKHCCRINKSLLPLAFTRDFTVVPSYYTLFRTHDFYIMWIVMTRLIIESLL